MIELGYAGITYNKTHIFAHTITSKSAFSDKIKIGTNKKATAVSYLRNTEKAKNLKIIACGLPEDSEHLTLSSDLWLTLDISPIPIKTPSKRKFDYAKHAAKFAKSQFAVDGSYSAKVEKNSKVITPPLATIQEYEKLTPPEEFGMLLDLAKRQTGKKILFISATPQGGGVALMRHSLMRILPQIGVDADWHVMTEDIDIFNITKLKFHNVLQTVADTGIVLDEKDKEKFRRWSKVNYKILKPAISKASIIVIDDPQPSGLVPHIRREFPKTPIIYRSHIQLVAKMADRPGTAQNASWEFIWENINSCDTFVSHPKQEFVPARIPKDKLVFFGATTDRLDGLNKELATTHRQYYLDIFNRFLKQEKQTPLDLTRPFIIQIARFDPSKGIPDLLETYRLLCERLADEGLEHPQLVIAGNGSIDDPDGVPLYNLAMEIISTPKFERIKDDVKVLRLPHYDQLLNTILRESTICLQLSHKEGFEVKVTEALMKAKPVVAYKSGGVPLQIRDKKTGFLVKTGDVNAVADKLHDLLTDKVLYQKMSLNALRNFNGDTNSISNAIYWLQIFNNIKKP